MPKIWCWKWKYFADEPCDDCYTRLMEVLGCTFRVNGEEGWKDKSDSRKDPDRIRTKD